jgi:glycosyltransferase involved in cell wall biosynthesis
VKTNAGATWAYAQAKWLVDNGVDVITALPSLTGGMAEAYKTGGLSIVQGDLTLPVARPWRLPQKIREVRALVSSVGPDLVHCHFVTNIVLLRLALRRSAIPRLFQVPGPLHLEHWPFRRAEIALSTPRDYWAGACERTCAIYRDAGIPSGRVFLNYYGGYGGRSCDEYQSSLGLLRRDLALSDDSVLVGMVSYFYKPKGYLLQTRGLKGHEDFIDAVALARVAHPEIVGVIVGDAWGDARSYVDRVKAYAERQCPGGVVFAGFRTDLKRVYRELAVAVHPSHSENLGGAAESLAAGVPSIATDVGGFPDIVVNQETGLLVAPARPIELARAITRMVEDRAAAEEMAGRGKRLVCALLDIEATGAAMLGTYEHILGATDGRA